MAAPNHATGKLRDAPARPSPAAPAGQARDAWDAAHARALRATLVLLDLADPRPERLHALAWHSLVFALGASCTEPPSDVRLRPFREGAGELIRSVADGLPHGQTGRTQRLGFVNHEAHAWTTLRADRSWTALLHRDGAAGVAFGCTAPDASLDVHGVPDGPLHMAWGAAVELLADALGGSGRARLSVLVNAALPRFRQQPVFYVDRAIELVPPSVDEVVSVFREIELATADPLPRTHRPRSGC
jgi:hypothetical protein